MVLHRHDLPARDQQHRRVLRRYASDRDLHKVALASAECGPGKGSRPIRKARMKNTDRVKKLTRRGFLTLAAGGAAGLAYLETRGRRDPRILPPEDPGAAQVAPVAGSFIPIFVKPSQVLDLATWKLNLPTNNQQVTQPALAGFYDDAFRVTEAVQFTVTCGEEPQPGSKF